MTNTLGHFPSHIPALRSNLFIAHPDRFQTLSGLAIKRISAPIGGKTPTFGNFPNAWAFFNYEL
jgi:hypothetical protein